MAKLAEHYVEISARLDKFNKGMTNVENRMTKIGKKMTAVGKKMNRYITLPIVAMGVLAVKAGADFEYAMTNAWAVTGEGEAALASMTAKAREMGATTIFSAKQAGDAMYYMASAGWDSKKMAEAIKPTLDLAAATQSDLAFATEAVIASMNQFQITTKDTGRVTNVFAAAIMGSQATLEKLKISMTYVGPIAHSLGYEIEETTAALMGLYNAGYEASTAGTALRMALAKLTLGTGATREGLANLGLSLSDVNPEIYSMTEIIRKLEERGASAGDVLKIFAVRAGPAMASLIAQGADALDKFEKEITDTKAAAEMAEKQIKTFKGSFKLLISIINEASIQIFAILGPIIKDLVDNKIRPAIKAFTELTEGKKKLILKIFGLVAALGPILLMFGALTNTIIPAVIVGIKGLATAMVFLATNPAGMVIVAVGAIIAMLLKLRWEQYKTAKEMAKFDDAGKASARHVKKAIELAGLSEEAYIKLRKAYGGNTAELFKAIKAGKHGKDLQFALITLLTEERKKRKELRDEQAKAKKIEDDARKRIRDMNEKMKKELELLEKLKTKAKEWAEVEKELGITTIEAKKEEIKKLNEQLATLKKKYEDGKYTAIEYAEASKTIKDEIDGLNKSLEGAKEKTKAWADIQKQLGIVTIEEKRKKVGELGQRLELLKGLYDEGKISLFDYTEGTKELTEELDELNESLDDTTGKADKWISLLKELGISTIEEQTEKTAELEEKLKLLKEQYDAGVISLAAYTEGSKKLRDEMEETTITIDTVSQVWNDAVKSMGENLLNFGEMTGNILKNITTVFGTFIQEMIKGFGKLVIAELLAAKKGIIIKKATAIASAIAKVFAKVPFPFNVAIAGTMFGVVGALFAKLMPKLEGGGWIPRPMLVEAGHGPRGEIIAQPSKLAEIISKEMPKQAGALDTPDMRPQKIILPLTVQIGGEKYEKQIVYIVNKRGELGDIKFPAKVII